MHHKPHQPKLKTFHGDMPMHGWYMNVAGVSLSYSPLDKAHHAGVILTPAGAASERTLNVFLDLDDAAFLRDALAEILRQHFSRQASNN
jgi:hypothetical protein